MTHAVLAFISKLGSSFKLRRDLALENFALWTTGRLQMPPPRPHSLSERLRRQPGNGQKRRCGSIGALRR